MAKVISYLKSKPIEILIVILLIFVIYKQNKILNELDYILSTILDIESNINTIEQKIKHLNRIFER